jgi:AcrR family transcriptional regulator
VLVPRRRQVSDAQIVRAARRVFLAHGTRVPVATVARELGVSAATLFVRMGTKDRLIAAAFWPPDPQVLRTLEGGYTAERAFDEQLLDVVVQLAEFAGEEIPATFTLYAAGLRAKPGDDFSDVTPARLRRALADWLRGAAATGVAIRDPRMAAEVILGTLEARALHLFLGKRRRGARETREYARGLLETLLGLG